MRTINRSLYIQYSFLFVCDQSFLEGFLLHIVLIFSRRIQMPYVALHWEVRIVEETIAWFATNLPSCVVSERIIKQLLIWPYIWAAIAGRILSWIVDQHGWIHAVSDSFFKMLQSLSKFSRILRHVHNPLKLLSSNSNVFMIVIRVTSVFVDGPFSLPAK